MRRSSILLVVIVLFSSALNAQPFLTQGLVGHYSFDGNAADASGNGNDGVVMGAELEPDRFGAPNRAFRFDAPGEKISTVAANGFPTGVQDFTVAFWMKVASHSGAHQIMICNDALEQFQVHVGPPNQDGSLQIGVQLGGTGAGFTGFLPWGLDTWYHIAVTKQGETLVIFRDGVERSRQNTSLGNGAQGEERHLNFGNRPQDGRQFFGSLDEVRLYNRALSAGEVSDLYRFEAGPAVALIKAVKPSFSDLVVGALYQLQVSENATDWRNHGAPFRATQTTMVYPEYWDVADWAALHYRLLAGVDLVGGLVAYYPFKGNSNDASGRGNHGTPNGATLAPDRSGRAGEAYAFNGVDNFIEIPASDVFELTTYTVSLWFNTARLPGEAAMLLSKGRNHFELHVGSPPFANSGIRFLPRLLNPTTGQYSDARDAGVQVNRWYHLAAVYDGAANSARLFLDGEELVTTYVTGPDGEDAVTRPARIGQRYDATGPNTGVPFEGKIDSLRIYNRTLNLNEIRALRSVAD